MSHFVGLVFGSNVKELLEPFDEALEVDRYIKYTKDEAIDEVKRRHAENYEYALKVQEQAMSTGDSRRMESAENILKKGLTISYEDAWKEAKSWGYELDEEETLTTRYNPDSKWDWYCTGGRWSGYLPSKMTDEDGENEMVDWGLVGDIDWDKYLETDGAPFCFITTEGEWHESASMGWWGMTADDKEEDVWNREFKEYLETLSDDVEVTVIDFHI